MNRSPWLRPCFTLIGKTVCRTISTRCVLQRSARGRPGTRAARCILCRCADRRGQEFRQVDILNFDKTTGRAPVYDRPLTLEIWYPAAIPEGKQERTVYEMGLPGAPSASSEGRPTFAVLGKALRNAPPIGGKLFPLVIVSHGYPGSRIFLSYLTENLASKGYVVVSIDHTDSVLGAVKPFPSTLLNRANDQLFTIGAIEDMARRPDHFLSGMVDDRRVAIVGYSMGGYGALAAAGAGYSRKSMAAGIVPGAYFDDLTAGSPKYLAKLRKEVRAVVAISPWGAQAPYNMWDADGLAGIRMPLLIIAGDQDDIADFKNGIEPVFEKTVNSDRWDARLRKRSTQRGRESSSSRIDD